MMLDDAKDAWQNAEDASETSLSDEALLSMVREEAEAFDEKIRRRDRREIIAAAVVFLFFSVMLLDPSWMVRGGALMVMASSVWIVWRIRRARRADASSSDRPVAEVIRTERAKVDRQIRLLETVLWWYIAPPALGLGLVVAGDAGLSWFTLVYGLGGVGFFGYVYHLNQRAVREDLRPRREKLTRLLRQFDTPDRE